MLTVNVSELKSRLSHYLRLVRRGQVLLVRDRDQVVARLEAAGPNAVGRNPAPDAARLARLEETGVLRRARRPLDPSLLARRVQASARVVEAALAEREEGR
jgi:antitoxin (DNA-binding transcriptional repressor) of toxin-antitoxin stability system